MDPALLHPQTLDVPALVTKARSYIDPARKAYARYLALPKSAGEQVLADDVSKTFDSLVTGAIEPTLPALQTGDAATAGRITMTVMPVVSLALTKSTNALNDYLMQHGASNYEEFQSTLHRCQPCFRRPIFPRRGSLRWRAPLASPGDLAAFG